MRPEAIAATLPWVVQAELEDRPSGPLAALLAAMEVLHERPERVLAELDSFFAPYRAPEQFVMWLAAWVDLAWLTAPDPDTGARVVLPGGTGRLRSLLLASRRLSGWRGTAAGLVETVDLVTGVPGSRVAPDPDSAFALRLELPAEAAPHVGLVRRVVDHVQPAHVTVLVEVVTETDVGPGRSADPISP